jgi:cytoskeletal protein CcmA (bactofilin family)
MGIGLFIPEGSTQKGDMNVDGDIRIEGSFQGTLSCEHTFTLGKNASFMGSIECIHAHIMGSLEGNIRSFETCILYPTAHVHGLLDTKIAQLEKGCTLQGEVFISGAS